MSLPLCPTDCTSSLPTVRFNLCAPTLNNAQISKFFFTTEGNPMINWASEVEWDSRLDNDATGASYIRTLIGIGSLGPPEKAVKDISLGRKNYGKRSYTLNFRVDETNADNHEAFRLLQCNTGNFLFWFQTLDGLLFGGNSGILGKLDVDIDIPEDKGEIITYPFTVTWDNQFMPEMIVSPITNDTGDQF